MSERPRWTPLVINGGGERVPPSEVWTEAMKAKIESALEALEKKLPPDWSELSRDDSEVAHVETVRLWTYAQLLSYLENEHALLVPTFTDVVRARVRMCLDGVEKA